MYIKRKIEDTILKTSNTFPVLLLTGPRQAGKTTLLEQLADSDRKYVTLDDPADRMFAKEEPQAFLERYSSPVIIDEIQYVPELLPYIKIAVDRNKNNGSYWLTGSQMFHMMKNVSESLAGRVGIVNLFGLSGNEITGNLFGAYKSDKDELTKKINTAKPMTLVEIFKRIHRGGMPRVYEQPDVDLGKYFSSYVQTYISRDIRELTQVADELAFYRFLCVVAARTGSMVNYEALAKETEISAPTAKQWLSILVSSGIIILIEPYHNNALKRVVKSPRMYFMDTGLAAYLTRWGSPDVLESGAMAGAFFETYVVSEIYKSFINLGQQPPLFFYRDSNTKEIDLIIWQDGTLYPIEIKKSSNPSGATKNFNALNPVTDEKNFDEMSRHLKMKIGTGSVICLANNLRPVQGSKGDNWVVPVWLI
ncbi:ATP-binding protein [Acetonema longum]|uniref:ATP-binding protein n=1 Tax=Acetonema longum TaxID=2374 RepID=UPI0002FCEAAB|nr:ATP-binding protein [Acetonema longum]